MNEITMIPIGLLEHHPENPRTDLGDLTELTESIRRQGILQNLTVVPVKQVAPGFVASGDLYWVVIGNRRFEAAKAAGLTMAPCRVADMDHKTQVATMLAENMHRRDLSVYEQALGFQTMMDLGFTPKEIGEKTGFSEKTVNLRLKLTKFRKKDFEQACERGATLMDFAELDKIEKAEDRYEVMMKAGTADFKAALRAKIREQEYQKHEKRLTALMEELDIAPIPANERYSNKYERFLDFEVKTPDKEIVDKLADKMNNTDKLVYELCRYYGENGELCIKREVKNRSTLSESEKQQRALSRKRNDHLKRTKAVYRQAFELRCEFVKHFSRDTPGGGGIGSVTEKCLESALNQKNSWDGKLPSNHNWDDANIRRIFDLPEKPVEGQPPLYWVLDEKANLCRIMLAFALGGGVVHDSEDIGWYDRSDGTFAKNDRYYTEDANRVYNLLTKCGYKLSEMEEQLRDGTHECYQWDE